jgi:putative membrane protein
MNSHSFPQPRRAQVSLLALAGAVLFPVATFGQTVADRATPPVTRDDRNVRVVEARPLHKADRDFYEKVAKASMAEVQISRVAATRTTNPEVKRFAQMMVEDHENATEQLAALAATRGISLPAKGPHPDKWEKRDARNFDRDYIDQMVSDHEDVVKLFQKQARDGEDAETVAFARKHLPKMQEHLQHALDLKRAFKDRR